MMNYIMDTVMFLLFIIIISLGCREMAVSHVIIIKIIQDIIVEYV